MSLPPGFLDELRSRLRWLRSSGGESPGTPARATPPAATGGRPVLSIRKNQRLSMWMKARATTIASVARPRATRSASCARPRISGFMEAVERLAADAGMPMPERDPAAAARAAANQGLVEAMEAAVQFYRLQLSTARAAEARAYLDRRGLAPRRPRPLRDRLRARWLDRAPRPPDRQGLPPREAHRGRPRHRPRSRRPRSTTASAAGSSSRSATPAAAASPSAPARSPPARSRNT